MAFGIKEKAFSQRNPITLPRLKAKKKLGSIWHCSSNFPLQALGGEVG